MMRTKNGSGPAVQANQQNRSATIRPKEVNSNQRLIEFNDTPGEGPSVYDFGGALRCAIPIMPTRPDINNLAAAGI